MYVGSSLYDGKEKSVKGGKGRKRERKKGKGEGPIRSDFPWRKFGGDWAHRISLEYVFGRM